MISLTVDETVLKHTAFATLALVLKFQATNLSLGKARIKSGNCPPEDASIFPKAGAQDFTGTAKPADRVKKDGNAKSLDRIRKAKSEETRALRVVSNDPFFLIAIGKLSFAEWVLACGRSSS